MNSLSKTDSVLIDALLEDIGNGDVTTDAIIPENHKSEASLIAKEDFILAGLPFAERVFHLLNPKLKFEAHKKDGDNIKKSEVIARVNGNTKDLLMTERTALNLLQRLSGIATLTHRFVERVKGLPIKIVDTRKTTPGFRIFEKYAVRIGGGHNHRVGLFDGVLIKDNHISATGSIEKAVKAAKSKVHHMLKVEVEVKNIKDVRIALSTGAEIIMLDNMPVEEIEDAVKMIRSKKPQVVIEASGNIDLENVRAVAEAGVDLISIGVITHSAVSVDISMKIFPHR